MLRRLALIVVFVAIGTAAQSPVIAKDVAAIEIKPPPSRSWSSETAWSEWIRLDSHRLIWRHYRMIAVGARQSGGTFDGPIPPCVRPEPGFLREFLPQLTLEVLVPEFRVTRALRGVKTTEEPFMLAVVRAAGVDVVGDYITDHFPGQMVASCASVNFPPEDGRTFRVASIHLFATMAGDRFWRECPVRGVNRECAVGASAWVSVPPNDFLVIKDDPIFDKYPDLRYELLYRTGILHQATVLNWSKRSLRAVAVVDFECDIGTAGCGLQ